MKTLWNLCLFALSGLLCGAGHLAAQPFISLTSTNNGSGLFSYTFTLADPNYSWGFSTNNGLLMMRFNGVQATFNPAGWTSTIETNDVVTWQCLNNNLVLLGSPSITFAIQSSSVTPALYNDPLILDAPYSRGVVVGVAYDVSTHFGIAGGYETFSYIGPSVVPEPSAAALFAAAMAGFGCKLFSGAVRPRRSRR